MNNKIVTKLCAGSNQRQDSDAFFQSTTKGPVLLLYLCKIHVCDVSFLSGNTDGFKDRLCLELPCKSRAKIKIINMIDCPCCFLLLFSFISSTTKSFFFFKRKKIAE